MELGDEIPPLALLLRPVQTLAYVKIRVELGRALRRASVVFDRPWGQTEACF